VTAAIRLLEKLRRLHPDRSHKEIWREIYRRVIPKHENLPAIERREAKHELRERVRWRLEIRRRRQRARQSK
jgi:hypothetical protein